MMKQKKVTKIQKVVDELKKRMEKQNKKVIGLSNEQFLINEKSWPPWERLGENVYFRTLNHIWWREHVLGKLPNMAFFRSNERAGPVLL